MSALGANVSPIGCNRNRTYRRFSKAHPQMVQFCCNSYLQIVTALGFQNVDLVGIIVLPLPEKKLKYLKKV